MVVGGSIVTELSYESKVPQAKVDLPWGKALQAEEVAPARSLKWESVWHFLRNREREEDTASGWLGSTGRHRAGTR